MFHRASLPLNIIIDVKGNFVFLYIEIKILTMLFVGHVCCWGLDCQSETVFIEDLQGNGPVCQVETSPEILLVYRTHPVMIVHKIFAGDTWCKGVKKLPKFLTYSSNSRHRARAWRQRA
jgi:hypothetical protein